MWRDAAQGRPPTRHTVGVDLAPDLHELGWCPFAMVTGKPCILCGGTRAVLSLLRGDLAAAWNFNASVLVLGTAALLVLSVEMVRGGVPAVRARIRTVTAPAGRSGVNLPLVVLFAVWWAWDLARW